MKEKVLCLFNKRFSIFNKDRLSCGCNKALIAYEALTNSDNLNRKASDFIKDKAGIDVEVEDDNCNIDFNSESDTDLLFSINSGNSNEEVLQSNKINTCYPLSLTPVLDDRESYNIYIDTFPTINEDGDGLEGYQDGDEYPSVRAFKVEKSTTFDIKAEIDYEFELPNEEFLIAEAEGFDSFSRSINSSSYTSTFLGVKLSSLIEGGIELVETSWTVGGVPSPFAFKITEAGEYKITANIEVEVNVNYTRSGTNQLILELMYSKYNLSSASTINMTTPKNLINGVNKFIIPYEGTITHDGLEDFYYWIRISTTTRSTVPTYDISISYELESFKIERVEPVSILELGEVGIGVVAVEYNPFIEERVNSNGKLYHSITSQDFSNATTGNAGTKSLDTAISFDLNSVNEGNYLLFYPVFIHRNLQSSGAVTVDYKVTPRLFNIKYNLCN